MKQILSEKNIAGVLFILVMVVFSFAHEDSKKRSDHYNVSIPAISTSKATTSMIIEVKEAQRGTTISN